MFTAVWAISTVIVGSASLSKVGSTGPVRMVARACTALIGAGEPEAGLAIAAGRSAALPPPIGGTSSSSPASPDGAEFCRLIGLLPRPFRGRLRAPSRYEIMIIIYYYDHNAMGGGGGHARPPAPRKAQLTQGTADAVRQGTQGFDPPAHCRGGVPAISRARRRRGGACRHHVGSGPDQRCVLRAFRLQGGSGPRSAFPCRLPQQTVEGGGKRHRAFGRHSRLPVARPSRQSGEGLSHVRAGRRNRPPPQGNPRRLHGQGRRCHRTDRGGPRRRKRSRAAAQGGRDLRRDGGHASARPRRQRQAAVPGDFAERRRRGRRPCRRE